jgi:hypothetical protein
MKNLRFRHWGREQRTVYDSAEKYDSSLDLIKKIPAKMIWSTNKLKMTGGVHAAKRVRPPRSVHDVLGLEALHSGRRICRQIPHGGGRDDRPCGVAGEGMSG